MLRSMFRGRTIRVPINRSNVEVQQVKVTRQNKPLVARFILTCIVTTVVIQGIKRWDPLGTYAQRDVLQEELERAKKLAKRADGDVYGKHWDKQHAQIKNTSTGSTSLESAGEDSIRLTVPIWLRRGLPRLLRETDPEWKEFVKLQGDPKRIETIKRRIGDSVIHQIKDHGLGKMELSIIRFNSRVAVNLEVVPHVFTLAPYEVPCIWISPKSIDMGWRPLPPQTGARLERVFRPIVLMEASTAAARTFFYMVYAVTKARISEAMGIQTSGGNKPTIHVPHIPQRPQNAADSSTSDQTKKPVFPMFPDVNADTMKKMHTDVVSSMPYSSAIQHAAFAFDRVRAVRQRMAASANMTGICQVRGYITCFGDRGKFRLEVIAHYHPADNVFVGGMNIKSGYIVQDYRAWEKTIEKEKQKTQQAVATRPVAAPGPGKSAGTPSTSNEEKEKK